MSVNDPLRTFKRDATSAGMVLLISVFVFVLGAMFALRPKRVADVMLRNSEVLSERYVRVFNAGLRVVGIGWMLFGGIVFALAMRG